MDAGRTEKTGKFSEIRFYALFTISRSICLLICFVGRECERFSIAIEKIGFDVLYNVISSRILTKNKSSDIWSELRMEDFIIRRDFSSRKQSKSYQCFKTMINGPVFQAIPNNVWSTKERKKRFVDVVFRDSSSVTATFQISFDREKI